MMPRPNAEALTLLVIVALILLLVALMPRKMVGAATPSVGDEEAVRNILGSLLNPAAGSQSGE